MLTALPDVILLIDNYDSFTYNLVQCLGTLDPRVQLQVVRNDVMSAEEIQRLAPSHLIISPGPRTPREAGVSVDCVRRLAGNTPILGVCLGHQSVGAAFGARIVPAGTLMHGKTDQIYHQGQGLFAGLPNPLTATRYHSLVIEPDSLSDQFEVTAWTTDREGRREIMGIQHRQWPVYGVQFHPESFLTAEGPQLLKNFLQITAPTRVAGSP